MSSQAEHGFFLYLASILLQVILEGWGLHFARPPIISVGGCGFAPPVHEVVEEEVLTDLDRLAVPN